MSQDLLLGAGKISKWLGRSQDPADHVAASQGSRASALQSGKDCPACNLHQIAKSLENAQKLISQFTQVSQDLLQAIYLTPFVSDFHRHSCIQAAGNRERGTFHVSMLKVVMT